MKRDNFVQKWERQRARGRVIYALLHGAVFAGIILLIVFAFRLFGQAQPENFSLQTAAYFALGGFAYGLIRFNIRERFYLAIKRENEGQTND